jgi:peptidoglycan/xylan/chitin deacetylase (PgdA/CDA1 family)
MSKTISISIDTEPDFGGRFGKRWQALEKMPEVLDLFDQYGVKATFFVECETLTLHEKLFHKAQSRGHEIASHGWGHEKITEQNIDEQLSMVKKAFKVFGSEPKGFRCPYLIRPDNLFIKLLENGFTYDSSLCQAYFPFRYNYLNVPNRIHRLDVDDDHDDLIEIPVSRMPLSFSAFTLLQSAIRLPSRRFWNKTENAVCYFHFSDIIQWDKPTMKKLPWYIQLAHKASKNKLDVLKKMIETFSDREFKTMEELA